MCEHCAFIYKTQDSYWQSFRFLILFPIFEFPLLVKINVNTCKCEGHICMNVQYILEICIAKCEINKMVCIFVQAMAMCLHRQFILTRICAHAMWRNQHQHSLRHGLSKYFPKTQHCVVHLISKATGK